MKHKCPDHVTFEYSQITPCIYIGTNKCCDLGFDKRLIKKGITAWEAAGGIHSDIQKGFIRAEIISFNDFLSCGGETQAKQAGKMRLEQKNYIMQDTDLVNFRFNK